MTSKLQFLLPATLLCGSLAAQDAPLPLLTTCREVARHPSSDPGRQPAVTVTAVVSYVDAEGTVFLSDDSGATFIPALARPGPHRVGQRLEISGIRHPGLFIGGIRPDVVTVLGEGPPPAARPTTLAELASGEFHYHLVETEGIVRSVQATGDSAAVMRMQVAGGILEVHFDRSPADAERLVDARVRVRGLAAGAITDRRQLVKSHLRANDADALTVLSEAASDPYARPDTPLPVLSGLAASGRIHHRVRIAGIALGPLLDGSLFLRCEGGAVRVRTRLTSSRVQAGDAVEAIGFPEMGALSALLDDGEFRLTGGPRTTVKPLTADGKGDFPDAELVTLEATVLQSLTTDRVMLASADGRGFRVISAGGTSPRFESGSRVRFTGIHRVTATVADSYRAKAGSFEILMRGPEDAVLISAPPWWNPHRLSVAFIAATAAALAAMIWAAMLKRQVARQVRVIHSKTEHEAMMGERRRIAREFHDTLEQELAGLTIRLDAALPLVTDEKALSLVDQSRRLLGRLQMETRDFIRDLRDDSSDHADLEKSLADLVAHLAATTSTPLDLTTDPGCPPVEPFVCHQLTRIVREAIHNAVKHSHAERISIRLTPHGAGLRLTISDEGRGFDPASAPPGHFGQQGMRERARRIGARFRLESQPGQGTLVEVELDPANH